MRKRLLVHLKECYKNLHLTVLLCTFKVLSF